MKKLLALLLFVCLMATSMFTGSVYALDDVDMDVGMDTEDGFSDYSTSFEEYTVGDSVVHTDQSTQFPSVGEWGGIKTAGYRGQTFAGTFYDNQGNEHTQYTSGSYSSAIAVTSSSDYFYSGSKSLYFKGSGWAFATAIENVKKMLDEKSIKTITNFDNPEIEEMVFDTQPFMHYFEEKTDIIGKTLYKITFNTTQDGLLGPLVFYIDKSSGDVIGVEYRY